MSTIINTTEPYKVHNSASQNQIIILISYVIRLLFSIILTIMLGRQLDPASFGFFSLISILFVLAYTITDLGTSDIAVREITLAPANEKSILEVLMGIRTLVGLVLCVFCLLIAFVENNGDYQIVLILFAIILPFLFNSALNPVFIVRQVQLYPALLSLGSHLFLIIFSIVLLYINAEGWHFALAVIIREGVVLVGLRILAKKYLQILPAPNFRSGHINHMLKSIFVIGAATILYSISFHVGTIFIWIMRTDEELGAYAAAFRVFLPLTSLPFLLVSPLLPLLTQLAATDCRLFYKQVSGLLYIATGIGAIIIVNGIYYTEDLLTILYGGKYLSGEQSAVIAMKWLASAYGFTTVIPIIIVIILATNRDLIILFLAGASFIINLFINLNFLDEFGVQVAAIATAISGLLFFICGLSFIFIHLEKTRFIINTFLCLMPAGLLIYIFDYLSAESSTIRILSGILISICAGFSLWLVPDIKLNLIAIRQFNKQLISKV